MTTVISVRGRDRSELLADPGFVYVGRQVGRGRNYAWPASDWGNPFKLGMSSFEAMQRVDGWARRDLLDRRIEIAVKGSTLDIESVLDLYRQWVQACPILRSQLADLRGKVLGCWCGSWKPGDPPLECHARILAELADGPMGGPR